LTDARIRTCPLWPVLYLIWRTAFVVGIYLSGTDTNMQSKMKQIIKKIPLRMTFAAFVLLLPGPVKTTALEASALNSTDADYIRATVPVKANKIIAPKPADTGEQIPARATGHGIRPGISLKVMTYNIRHCEGLDGKISVERIFDVIHRSNADIIGLQEVDRYSIRTDFQDQIRQIASKLGYDYAFGTTLGVSPFGYGNGVLSRYPIVSSQNLSLPSRLEQRGALKTIIKLDNGFNLTFINTHLGLSKSDRKNQIKALIKSLDGVSKGSILVGDFNTTSEASEFAELNELFDDSYKRADHRDGDKTLGNKYRVDFVWCPPDFKPTSWATIPSDASDHLPVVVDLISK